MFEKGMNTMNLHGKKINILGDSITEGVGVSSQDHCYINLIADRCGATCRNYGISGSRIAIQHTPSANPRFDLYFASRVDEMAEDADIIIVFGGTNDFGHGDAPWALPKTAPLKHSGAVCTPYTPNCSSVIRTNSL